MRQHTSGQQGVPLVRAAHLLLPGLLLVLLLAPGVRAEVPDYQHGISLLHELKYKADFTHFEYANPDAPKGGRIVLSMANSVRNFSGARGGEVPNAQGLGRTVDRLMIRTADELSGLYGWLADGIALSADRTRLYLRLHAEARWHDGVPITTGDIVFSYEDLLQTVFGKVYLASWIERIEIVNAKELVIHHRSEFTNSNLTALVWFAIRPAHYYADLDPAEATLTPPVGSGPYRVREFTANYIVYERVDDYWGRNLPIHKGRYNFEEIRYELYRDATVAREAFRKGLIDLYFETDVRHWVSSYDTPARARGEFRADTRRVSKFIGLQSAIALNLERPHLQDVRVREALTLALDFEWQNRVFSHGTRERALSYFANSSFAAEGVATEAERSMLAPYADQLPAKALTEAFTLPVSAGRGDNRPALERARTLLEAAGWRVQAGRLVDAGGRPFTFDLLTQDPAARRVLLPYVAALEQLGIEVRLRLLDSVIAVNFLRSRDFDGYLRGHDFLNPPVGELRSYFGSATADMELGGNLAGIRDPVVDGLIEQAERAGTIDEVRVACRALDRVLLWGYYHIPLHIPEQERFLYWDKFKRPARGDVARYEYLVGSSLRILDSWWSKAGDQQELIEGRASGVPRTSAQR